MRFFYKIMQHQRCCRNYKDVDQSKQNQGLKRGWDRSMMGGVKKVRKKFLYSILFYKCLQSKDLILLFLIMCLEVGGRCV